MSLVAELPSDGSIVPFIPVERAANLFMICIVLPLSIIGDSLVLWATCRQRNLPINSYFLISFTLADLVFSLIGGGFGVANAIAGGWSGGRIGCAINGAVVVTTGAVSVITLIAMTFDRYFVIMKGFYLSKNQGIAIVIGLWTFVALIVAYPFYSVDMWDHVVALQPAKLGCAVAWWDSNPFNVFANIAIVTGILFGSVTMIGVYTQIFLYFRAAGQKTGDLASNQSRQSRPKSLKEKITITSPLSANEKKLFLKSAAITFCFVNCWTPMLINILVSMCLHKPSPLELDIFASVCAASSCFINAFLMIYYDAKTYHNVVELFPESWVKRFSILRLYIMSGTSPSAAQSLKVGSGNIRVNPINLNIMAGSDSALGTRIIPNPANELETRLD